MFKESDEAPLRPWWQGGQEWAEPRDASFSGGISRSDVRCSKTPLGPGSMEGWWVRVRSSAGVCQVAGDRGHLEIPSRPERVFTSSPQRWHGGFDYSELSAERRGRG